MKIKLDEELKQIKTTTQEKQNKEKDEMSKELTEMKKQIKTFEKNVSDHTLTMTKEKTKIETLNTKLITATSAIKKLEDEKSDTQSKLKKLETHNAALSKLRKIAFILST